MSTPRPEYLHLDYHTTTPVDPMLATKVMALMISQFDNASSVDHAVGDRRS